MTERVRHSSSSSQQQKLSVADYIVHRLANEGISHCFGVAGDYAFPLCDAVDRSPEVKWIGCANELNASYAADGYARVRGAAMLVTTYGVGELSALNGVMGAKAEHSLVFHLVGMPSYQHQRLHKIAHHTLGDGVFGNFVDMSARAACCHAVITPDNCMIEMERLIAEARLNNQPAYIAVPSDFAITPVVWNKVNPVKLASNDASLRTGGRGDPEADRWREIGRRLAGVYPGAIRAGATSAKADRGARLPVRHNRDGKGIYWGGPCAIRRHLCRGGFGQRNAQNCRGSRSDLGPWRRESQ